MRGGRKVHRRMDGVPKQPEMSERLQEALKRLVDSEAPQLTPAQECLAGECGPWIKPDRAEFHHADARAQQWFIRLDKQEVLDLEFAIRLGVAFRSAVKWTRRCIYALGASFAAVWSFGEKLGKLPETMQSAISGAFKALEMLHRLFGQ